MMLPLSYEDVKHEDAKASDGSSKQADAATAPSAEPPKQAAPKETPEAVSQDDKALFAGLDLEAPHHMEHRPDCPHKDGNMPSFGSIIGSIVSQAAKDIFGIEQIITDNMHDMFEDILSGPTIPHILDVLEGVIPQAGMAPTILPPFIGGPRDGPVFNVVITSSPESSDSDDSLQPTWEQEVIISSSSPGHLEQLADMFEQQLQSSDSLGRKLKSQGRGKVQTAQVAQVLLVAGRQLRAAGVLPVARTH